MEIITVLCGAILSYIIYAIIQVFLIIKYANFIFKNQKNLKLYFKGYPIEIYNEINEELYNKMVDLQFKIKLLRGYESKKINKLINNLNLNSFKYLTHYLELWAKNESINQKNDIYYLKSLDNVYISTFGEKEICFINEEHKKSFELFLSEYNIECDFKINIK